MYSEAISGRRHVFTSFTESFHKVSTAIVLKDKIKKVLNCELGILEKRIMGKDDETNTGNSLEAKA